MYGTQPRYTRASERERERIYTIFRQVLAEAADGLQVTQETRSDVSPETPRVGASEESVSSLLLSLLCGHRRHKKIGKKQLVTFLAKKRICQYLVTLLFKFLRRILAGMVP